MQQHASNRDSVNEGRQRRSQNSMNAVERMLSDLEQRVGLTSDRIPAEEDACLGQENAAAAEQIATALQRLHKELGPSHFIDSEGGQLERRAALRKAISSAGHEAEGNFFAQLSRLERNLDLLALRADQDDSMLGEIAQIRTALERMAQEEDGRSESRGSANPDWRARELALLAERLEAINRALCSLPKSASVRSLEDRLRALALSVEQFAKARSEIEPGRFQELGQRLDEILDAITESSAMAQASSEDLARIEARISTIGQQFEKFSTLGGGAGLLTCMQQLADRVEELVSVSELPATAIGRLARQVEHLSLNLDRKLDDLPGGSRMRVLEDRLDTIIATLSANTRTEDQEGLIEAIDAGFIRIGQQLENLASTGIDPELIRSLENQLAELNRHMARPIDRVQLTDAASPALGAQQSGETDWSRLASIAAELRQLEEFSRLSDQRHSRVFASVQDSLAKILDRLSRLDAAADDFNRQIGLAPFGNAPSQATNPVRNLLDRIRIAREHSTASNADASAAWSEHPVKAILPRSSVKAQGKGSLRRLVTSLLFVACLSVAALAAFPLGKAYYRAQDRGMPIPATVGQAESADRSAATLTAVEEDHGTGDLSEATADLQEEAETKATGSLAARTGVIEQVADHDDANQRALPIRMEDIPADMGPAELREAAVQGDARALYEVGARYAEGRGVEKNMPQAMRWFDHAAAAGHAPAQYRLAHILEKGLAGTRDTAKAMELYRKAAEQGSASAMHNLAVLFALGAAGEPDNLQAAEWFRQAADLGVTDSQYNLGILLAKGAGIERDLVQSFKWFTLAAISGDEDAAAKQAEIGARLTPEELADAKAMVEAWTPAIGAPEVNGVDIPEEWQEEPDQLGEKFDLARAVTSIQILLNRNGYDAGPADGVMGDRTRSAIASYRQDIGLPPGAEVDEALVEALLKQH